MLSDPIWLFRRQRFIVPQTLESQLRGFRPWTLRSVDGTADGPSVRASAAGVRVDLSRAEWIDLASLVQIALLIEALSQRTVRVEVALPRRTLRRSEEQYLASAHTAGARISRQVGARVELAEILEAIGFREILETLKLEPARAPIDIIDDWDNSRVALNDDHGGNEEEPSELGDDDESAQIHRQALSAVIAKHAALKMRWILPGDAECSRVLASELIAILHNLDTSSDSPDANVLKNVVLHEILDNMSAHAGNGARAIVVGWARPKGLAWSASQGWPSEEKFAERLWHDQIPSIEFVIGDSGLGLLRTLTPAYDLAVAEGERGLPRHARKSAAVLQWAFHRWSSSRDRSASRGTRGLYRLARVVRRYAGLTTIRAADEVISLDHADATNEVSVGARSLAASPGTTLRVLLPARVPIAGYAALAPEPESQTAFEILRLGPLEAFGLSEQQGQVLLQAFSQSREDMNVCIAIEARASSREAAVALLHRVSELRHPPQAIVTLEGSTTEEIEEWVAEANEPPSTASLDSAQEEHANEVFDPVMVLLPTGKVCWVGVPKRFNQVFRSLVEAPDGRQSRKQLAAALGSDHALDDFRRYIREDPNLLKEDADGHVQLQLTVAGLARHVDVLLSSRIEKQIQLQNGVLGTHELWRTKAWLAFPTILELSCGRALARALLAWRARSGLPVEQWKRERRILVGDSQSSAEDLVVLKDSLRCKLHWLLPSAATQELARDGRALPNGHDVVIHADIVASGEAVARCIRQAQRELCRPVLITCFVDARRKPDEPFEFKGRSYQIVSLVRAPALSNCSEDTAILEFIDPLTGSGEASQRPDDASAESTWRLTPALAQELADASALYFSHVSRPNGRHFTIGLRAQQLVRMPRLYERAQTFGKDWISRIHVERPETTCTVWYPRVPGSDESAARELAETVARSLGENVRVEAVDRVATFGRWRILAPARQLGANEAVAIVDWACLSGTTIEELAHAAGRAGANHVLAIALVAQLPSAQRRVVENTTEFQVVRSPNVHRLLAENIAPDRPSPSAVSIHFRFVLELPLTGFDRESCPLCSQNRELDRMSQERSLISSTQHSLLLERLRVRSRLPEDPEIYNGVDGHQITPEELGAILTWRAQLESALTSTRARWSLAQLFAELANVTSAEHARTDRESLIHLLSVESHWLRLPPCDFTIVRGYLARIALVQLLGGEMSNARLIQALIVLRVADSAEFFRELPKFLTAASGLPRVQDFALYLVASALHRPYRQGERHLRKITAALEEARKNLEANAQNDLSQDDSVQAVRTLYRQAGALLERQRSRTPILAWMRLDSTLIRRKGDAADVGLKALERLNLSGPHLGQLAQLIKLAANGEQEVGWSMEQTRAIEDLPGVWEDFLDWLLLHILPFVSEAAPAILARVRNVEGQTDVSQLIFLAQSPFQHIADLSISRIVRDLRSGTDPAAVLTPTVVDSWQREWNFWNRTVAGEDSALGRLLRQVPSRMPEVLEKLQSRLRESAHLIGVDRIGDDQRNPSLFCPQSTLVDCLADLVQSSLPAIGEKPHEVVLKVEMVQRATLVTQFTFFPIRTSKGLREPSDRLSATIVRVRDELSGFDVEVDSHAQEDRFASRGFVLRIHHC